MKTNTTRTWSQRKKLLVVVSSIIVVLLIAGGAFAYVQVSNNSTPATTTDTNSINNDPATDDQIDNGDTTKSNSVNNSKPTDTGSDQPATTADTHDGKDVVAMRITSLPLDVNDNGLLSVRLQIDSEVNDGTCVLNLTKSGSTTLQTSVGTFQSGPQYSTCKGFDIDTTGMDNGTWNLDVVFENGTKYGHVTGTVNI